MTKKQLKDAPRTTKRHIERRPAGQPAAGNESDVKLRFPVPQPRPIPRDHPARDIFRKENISEDSSHEIGVQPPVPSEIAHQSTNLTTASAIPLGIPTAIPSATATFESTPGNQQLDKPNASLRAETPIDPARKKNSPRTTLTEETSNARTTKAPDRADDLNQATTPLDATHTASEKIIYSIMYRETISRQTRERHFGPAELMKKSGIRSRNTVHQAIYGLIKKLSIEVVSKQVGNALGPRYRVYRPQEVEERRRQAGIFIDEQSKKIISESEALSRSGEGQGTGSLGIPTGIPNVIPEEVGRYPKIWDTTIPKFGIPGIPKFGIVLNSKDNTYGSTGALPSSSSIVSRDDDADDEKLLDFVRECYVRATGNEWTTADAATVLKTRGIAAEMWGIAICYCVDRAPDHKFARLAYVVDEARRHQEEMSGFSASDLRAILAHSLRTIERARSSGSWRHDSPDISDSADPVLTGD